MEFTFRCPACKNVFTANHADLAADSRALKCCLCGNAPAPDIQTAYQNIGKTITELHGCCSCDQDKSWLPLSVKHPE